MAVTFARWHGISTAARAKRVLLGGDEDAEAEEVIDGGGAGSGCCVGDLDGGSGGGRAGCARISAPACAAASAGPLPTPTRMTHQRVAGPRRVEAMASTWISHDAHVHLGPLAALPDWYWGVPYVGARFPGAVPRGELAHGANCQLWAYEVLDYLGLAVPDHRSDELWHDASATRRVEDPNPLDLVLYNRNNNPYGAHVGLWTGDAVAHLCAEVGRPTVWAQSEFDARPRYAVRIGFKRPTTRLQ